MVVAIVVCLSIFVVSICVLTCCILRYKLKRAKEAKKFDGPETSQLMNMNYQNNVQHAMSSSAIKKQDTELFDDESALEQASQQGDQEQGLVLGGGQLRNFNPDEFQPPKTGMMK